MCWHNWYIVKRRRERFCTKCGKLQYNAILYEIEPDLWIDEGFIKNVKEYHEELLKIEYDKALKHKEYLAKKSENILIWDKEKGDIINEKNN